MKQKTQPAVAGFAIFTNICGRKNYVASQSVDAHNRYHVHYHTDAKEAVPFATEAEVTEYKKNIHNPSNREYLHEAATFPAGAFDAEPTKRRRIFHNNEQLQPA
jgi:hypothetical protein